MSTVIHENQPCYFTKATGTAGNTFFATDSVGSSSTTVANNIFRTQFRNAILQTIVVTPSAGASETVTLSYGESAAQVIHTFKTSGVQETHAWDLGGDAGVLAPNGFNFTTAQNNTQVTIFWRPQ